MNGSRSPIGFGGGGGAIGNGLAMPIDIGGLNGFATGNSFVSVGGVKGIDGPTGKGLAPPPRESPIEIGGCGLPILGG
jgi:hypothetical protein